MWVPWDDYYSRQARKEINVGQLQLKEISFHDVGPLNLTIAAGECVSLMGQSGCGKTLLLRSIADLDPHGGELLLDGNSSTGLPAPKWRMRVALLPAKSSWWSDRVGDHFRQFDESLFGRLGFNEDVLSWEVSRLSTGEQQRLALLRLFQNNPKVLLLDEPTASLDTTNITKVEELIKQYREDNNAATLWVTHDKDQADRVSTRQYQLARGQLTGLNQT